MSSSTAVGRKRAPSTPIGVDRFDWEIVAFVVKWAQYGGPREDDVMPAFGMTCQELQKRFTTIVNALIRSESLRVTRQQHELLKRALELVAADATAVRRE